MDDSSVKRQMRTYRLGPETLRLVAGLAAKLTAKDGVRKVSATEVLERAVRVLARKEGVS